MSEWKVHRANPDGGLLLRPNHPIKTGLLVDGELLMHPVSGHEECDSARYLIVKPAGGVGERGGQARKNGDGSQKKPEFAIIPDCSAQYREERFGVKVTNARKSVIEDHMWEVVHQCRSDQRIF